MKTLLLLTIIFSGLFLSSCTSEYEERLEEGKELIQRIEFIKQRQSSFTDEMIQEELMSINNELSILARLSGNEELYLSQLRDL